MRPTQARPPLLRISDRFDRASWRSALPCRVAASGIAGTGLSAHLLGEAKIAPAFPACQRGPGLFMRGWLRPDAARKSAEELYAAAVAQARRPEFYASLGVPDTIDGRFELVALHTFLVLRRLKGQGQAAEAGQALVDLFIQDMDASLRELGAGDLGVGRKVKAMAQAFYGRIAAYDSGLAGSAATLEAALRRN